MFSLTGKVALVTGANSGIGRAMAIGLATAGASVAISGRNQEKNAAVAGEVGGLGVAAIAVQADVRDPESCRAMVEETVRRLGRLDILINNAGTNIRKAPESYSLDEWREVLDTNLTSVFVTSQAAHPHMRRAGGGKIVNIGSMLSIFGAPFAAPYGASKGGVVQLTKGLATAWARDNIQVNAVLPGWIDTPLTTQARIDVDGLHDRVLARTPSGRWGVPEDLAGIAVFLAAAASDFITGVAIPVDGGYSAQG
jgi:2-dehydro-3-deoxy-D-gluconate 5-dehydrogenase